MIPDDNIIIYKIKQHVVVNINPERDLAEIMKNTVAFKYPESQRIKQVIAQPENNKEQVNIFFQTDIKIRIHPVMPGVHAANPDEEAIYNKSYRQRNP